MGKSRFDLMVEAIDADLDYLHKQRWNTRAAELHDAEDRAQGDDRERARQELREHYDNRFRPETSRVPLIERARKNHSDQQSA